MDEILLVENIGINFYELRFSEFKLYKPFRVTSIKPCPPCTLKPFSQLHGSHTPAPQNVSSYEKYFHTLFVCVRVVCVCACTRAIISLDI